MTEGLSRREMLAWGGEAMRMFFSETEFRRVDE